jgi:hypothetical protein
MLLLVKRAANDAVWLKKFEWILVLYVWSHLLFATNIERLHNLRNREITTEEKTHLAQVYFQRDCYTWGCGCSKYCICRELGIHPFTKILAHNTFDLIKEGWLSYACQIIRINALKLANLFCMHSGH